MTRAASKASLIQNTEERESGGVGEKGKGGKVAKKGKQKELLQNKSDIEWSLGKVFFSREDKGGEILFPEASINIDSVACAC